MEKLDPEKKAALEKRLPPSLHEQPQPASPPQFMARSADAVPAAAPAQGLPVPVLPAAQEVEEDASEEDLIEKPAGAGGPAGGSGSGTPSRTKRKNFSHEEDETIMAGYAQFGADWEKIVTWGKLERPSDRVSARFRRIKQKAVYKAALAADEDAPQERQNGTFKTPEPPTKMRRSTSGTAVPTAYAHDSSAPQDEQQEPSPPSQLLQQQQQQQQLAQQNAEALVASQLEVARLQGIITKDHDVRQRFVDLARTLAIQKASAERKIARDKHHSENARLGHVTTERRGVTDTADVWQDGWAFRNITTRLEEISQRREELQAAIKVLRKSSADLPGQEEQMREQEEIMRTQLASLKKEEGDLAEERQKLSLHKYLHLRESKRILEEDNSPLRKFPLLQDRYQLLNLLGTGGFSEVYEAVDLVEGRMVACKLHSLNSAWNEQRKKNYLKHACREYNIHKQLVHAKVVRLFDVFEINDNAFCTVLEYCPGGDLENYLKQHKTLPEKEAKCIITQIVAGLTYLHGLKQPIIHYDLKPGNILFTHTGEIKIADFGLSKIMDEGSAELELTSVGAGTYWYLPPECLFFQAGSIPMISHKVDIWSVGVILYQMIYGKRPFGDNLTPAKFRADAAVKPDSHVDFPPKPSISDNIKDFVRRCLSYSCDERPDAATCLAELQRMK